MENTALAVNSTEQLKVLSNNAIIELLSRYNDTIEAIAKEQENIKANQSKLEVDLREEIKQNNDSILKSAEKASFINSRVYSGEFLNRTQLGKLHNPIISSQSMTKLMKFASIIQATNGDPYTNMFYGSEPICQNKEVHNQRTGYNGIEFMFHKERTWKKIHNALERNSLYDEFLICKTTDELRKFIDDL